MTLADFFNFAAGGLVEAQAVIVVIVSLIAMRLTLSWVARGLRRAHVDLGTQILVKRALVVIWIVITALVVLGILGVNPTGLVAVLGAVTLAFSLALQDILKNFFSGVYLLLERPFRVGDTIKVKDQTGVVENIGVRTTRLRTVDNVEVMVPNATVFSEVVLNQTFARSPTLAEEKKNTEEGAAPDGHATSSADPALRRE
jgi:small-conductance mechanosensitive channel